MTDAIITAIEHVRQAYPEVDRVYFDSEQRWYYTNGVGATPRFDEDEKIDYNVLEAALDEAWDTLTIPCAFKLDSRSRILTPIEPVEDIEDVWTDSQAK